MASWAGAHMGLRLLCPGVSPKDPTSHRHLSPITQLPSPAAGPCLPPRERRTGYRAQATPCVHGKGRVGLPWVLKRVPPAPDSKRVCLQLKTQLERTEALLGDEQTRRQKLTAEFEEVRVLLS